MKKEEKQEVSEGIKRNIINLCDLRKQWLKEFSKEKYNAYIELWEATGDLISQMYADKANIFNFSVLRKTGEYEGVSFNYRWHPFTHGTIEKTINFRINE